MAFSSIKEGLKRFFWGKVLVSGFAFPLETGARPLAVCSSRREISVFPVRSAVRVAEARCAEWNGMKARGRVLDLFISPPKIEGGPVGIGGSRPPQARGALFSKARSTVRDGEALISRLPQVRRNMASSWSDKTGQKNVIALFYPVIKEGVVKSALEKESGSLYVWYNPSCQGASHILCLVSDPGKRPPLSWKWL